MGRIEDLGGFIVYNYNLSNAYVSVAGCLGYDVLVNDILIYH